MDFWNWLEANWLGLTGLAGAVLGPTVAILLAWFNSRVLIRQIRPQVVAHGCRVSELDMYTYFDEGNKSSEPACVYLASDGSRDCRFDPQTHRAPGTQEKAKKMLEINGGKCYLALWGEKVSRAAP